jgi:serine/threonine protein kinase
MSNVRLATVGTPSGSNSSLGRRQMLADRFLLGEELGRGAYGVVIKAIDSTNGGPVAIKKISLTGFKPEQLQEVMGEIELLKTLNHHNIVAYLGSFKSRDSLYIILEYMENGSLASVIKANRYGVLTETLAAAYIGQVLQGLQYLHDQGVVHRDIKGANILTTQDVSIRANPRAGHFAMQPLACCACSGVGHWRHRPPPSRRPSSPQGLVKLADFGVAAKLGGDKDKGQDSLKVDVAGTPYWMAPEVRPGCVWGRGGGAAAPPAAPARGLGLLPGRGCAGRGCAGSCRAPRPAPRPPAARRPRR